MLKFVLTIWVTVLFVLWFILQSVVDFIEWIADPACVYLGIKVEKDEGGE